MMLRFNEYVQQILTEAVVNKHSTHIEELIFTKGKEGVENAIEGLRYIVDNIGKKPPVSVKIDGCVHANTRVVTISGNKKISELTDFDQVMCYDINRNKFVYCSNTRPRITGKSKPWVRVTLNNHGEVMCTKDHEWLTPKLTWLEAGKLKRRNVWCGNGAHTMHVDDVTDLKSKYDQWDLTTPYSNFVIDVNGDHLILHNSPAVFLINGDKGFAVASKGIFNKSAKVNYTEEDIDANHTGGLASKLKASLKYLRGIMPNTKNTIYQGDLLYTQEDLKIKDINGEQYYAFQPNTLMYTVPVNSAMGNAIRNSKIGIAVHTQYSWDGKDPSTLDVTEFGISKDIFKKSNDAFVIDTHIDSDDSRMVTFTDVEMATINALFKDVNKLATQINWDILDGELGSNLQTYLNTYIRNDVRRESPERTAAKFFDWVEDQVTTKKAKLKTEKGKAGVDAKYTNLRSKKQEMATIVNLLSIFEDFTKIKLAVIKKLNALTKFKKFVIKSNGDMVPTGDEGFVITGSGARGAKLVDRYTFSRNNFSKDIIKGWQHPNE
jgi:hypothetical protein